jgi:hypothetical protein
MVSTVHKTVYQYVERNSLDWLKVMLDKRCPVARASYHTFPRQDEKSEIVLWAASWNSPQRILGHAFRALLRSTFGHSSNTLVTTYGQLVHIDFEKMVYSDGTDDIELLRSHVERSSKVVAACKQVGQLNGRDIHDALAGIPERFWAEGGVFDNPTDAAAYFCDRLRVWKRCFD